MYFKSVPGISSAENWGRMQSRPSKTPERYRRFRKEWKKGNLSRGNHLKRKSILGKSRILSWSTPTKSVIRTKTKKGYIPSPPSIRKDPKNDLTHLFENWLHFKNPEKLHSLVLRPLTDFPAKFSHGPNLQNAATSVYQWGLSSRADINADTQLLGLP